MPASPSTDPKDARGTAPAPDEAIEQGLPTAIVALKVVEALASAPGGLGVTRLAQLLGMPKARVHRHLSVLREHGYVAQDPDTNQYRVGWQMFLLARACNSRFDVVSLARPVLESLRDQVGQTVVISTFSDNEVVVIDLLRGTAPVEISLRPGTRFHHNSVAQGKIVLAFGAQKLRDGYLQQPLPACTPRTIVDPERLAAEIALVRRRGWADAPEELYIGINALAAPLLQADGELFGTLAIVGSIHYLPSTPDPAHVQALLDAAGQISAAMGHTG
ncbi:IclR family transcriptional regulator [Stenotrophomonas mori]|uniref:IclR family transcriptional regulator n=1 Tax=Stenotrophomonas mori TaxID=2871096 RepID=A0ABT0SIK7_9GAMM|nr:IclR family transcriptional regulator [Stenotrophomonas mori]MCL7715173.1 IclR family transcriptional regulator [Stenotrophomonas mori]